MSPPRDAFGGAALFVLGMAAAVHEIAKKGNDVPADCVKDLEQVCWNNRTAALQPVAVQLDALHNSPVCFGEFVRPNAHLICFDYARRVLHIIWREIDPTGYQIAELAGYRDVDRIDLAHLGGRWPAAARSLCSLVLPDHREIASAVQQEGAKLATAQPSPTGTEKGEGETQPADPFTALRSFAKATLKGQERAVVEALCDAGGGPLPIADLALKEDVGWDDPKRSFANVQRRLKSKLSRQGWTLFRHENAANLRAAVKARKTR